MWFSKKLSKVGRQSDKDYFDDYGNSCEKEDDDGDEKNINQLCTELTVIKDEFLLFTMILRLRIVVKLFCNFFTFLREKFSNICICRVKCISFVQISKMVSEGILRSTKATRFFNLLRTGYKIHLCQ